MADVGEWAQRDEYYWTGPGGWTICRVFAQARWQFEVWAGSGTRHGMEASLAKAIQLYERIKS
jgi:hypothetical protein